MIKVAGFQNNSFIDYPGLISSVVFLGGCNIRCYYCHNFDILDPKTNTMEFSEVMEKLRAQIGFVDGVVITGGEPTVHPHLVEMINAVRGLGFLVKLDTNGTNPALLRELVEGGLVDYVAMDVKAPLERYAEIVGAVDTNKIAESIVFLKSQNKVDYMFRTTLAPMLTIDDAKSMALLLSGAKTFQLQQFVANEFSNSGRVVRLPYTKKQAEEFAAAFKGKVGQVLMRGF